MTHTTTQIDLFRKLALMQHLDEEFFIIDPEDNGEYLAFEGNEIEARKQFEADIEGTEEANIEANFAIFCSNNLTQVNELSIDDCYDEDYYVLTDEEADEKVKEYISNSLWAFNAEFILEECGLDLSGAESLRNMQSKSCEGANDFIRSLIDKCTDIDTFVESAISADGRGHFISFYDGSENEETVEGETFYIYRIN